LEKRAVVGKKFFPTISASLLNCFDTSQAQAIKLQKITKQRLTEWKKVNLTSAKDHVLFGDSCGGI
jgi:hypothetical protein